MSAQDSRPRASARHFSGGAVVLQVVVLAFLLMGAFMELPLKHAAATTSGDWTTYLYGCEHSDCGLCARWWKVDFGGLCGWRQRHVLRTECLNRSDHLEDWVRFVPEPFHLEFAHCL